MNDSNFMPRAFLKAFMKNVLYVVAFLALVFISLLVASYFWFEGLKLEMDGMMSFDRFEE